MKIQFKKLALFLATTGLFAYQANATIAYNTSNTTALIPTTNKEIQGAGGPFSLGMVFTANQNITVTSLGLFDYGLNGIAGTVQVGIYTFNSLNPAASTLVGSLTSFSGTDAPLAAGSAYRLKSVVTQFQLSSGTAYEIVAFNFGGNINNRNYNWQSGGPSSAITTDTGGGALTFGTGNYYNLNGANLPNTYDTVPFAGIARYGAGTFEFNLSPVPEAGAFSMAGALLLGLIYAARWYSDKRQQLA